jgi:hypothetical protein
MTPEEREEREEKLRSLVYECEYVASDMVCNLNRHISLYDDATDLKQIVSSIMFLIEELVDHD